jgi:hypothetical protein
MGESEEILKERYATPLKSAEILIGKKKLRAFASRAESLLPKAQRLLNEVDILLKNPEIERLTRTSLPFERVFWAIALFIFLLILLLAFLGSPFSSLVRILATLFILLILFTFFATLFSGTRNSKGIIKEINSLIEDTNKIIDDLSREGIYVSPIAPVELVGEDSESLRSALNTGKDRLLNIIGFLQTLRKYKEGK